MKKFFDFVNEDNQDNQDNKGKPNMDSEKQKDVRKKFNNIKDRIDAIGDKLDTVKFSELDGEWSKPGDKRKYTGIKDLDSSVGEKVLEMLKTHGLSIECAKGDYLNKQDLLLKDEDKFVEYRVRLVRIIPWDDFLENEGYYTEKEFEELSDDEQLKLVDEYEENSTDDSGDMEFSVFLPVDTPNHELKYLALSDATNYLNVLNTSIPAVTKGGLNYNIFGEYPEETTKFINDKNIRINNKNLPIVNKISYRLYRDSKFFGNVEYEFNVAFLNDLINDWLKIS